MSATVKPRFQWSRHPMETDYETETEWGGYEEYRPAGGYLWLSMEHGKHEARLNVGEREGRWRAVVTIYVVDGVSVPSLSTNALDRTIDREGFKTMREAKIWAEQNARPWLDAVAPVVREQRAEDKRIRAEAEARYQAVRDRLAPVLAEAARGLTS